MFQTKKYQYLIYIIVSVILLNFVGQKVMAAAPTSFIYQGQLTDSSGNSSALSYLIRFSLYKNQFDETALWSETKTIVTDNNGIFSTELGDSSPIDLSIMDGSKLYLGIKIENNNELRPRQIISSVPYAMRTNIPELPPDKIAGTAATLRDNQMFDGRNVFTKQLEALGGDSTQHSLGVINSLGGIGLRVQTNSDDYPALYIITGVSEGNLTEQNGTGPLLEAWSGSYSLQSGGSKIERKILFENNGDIKTVGTIFTNHADLAQLFVLSDNINSLETGDVILLDNSDDENVTVTISLSANSTLIAGVYSPTPAIVGSHSSEGSLENSYDLSERAALFNEIAVAVSGIVLCKVTDENGAIAIGDLLVSSSLSGRAMKAINPQIGTILGKALQSHPSGAGLIKILLTLN